MGEENPNFPVKKVTQGSRILGNLLIQKSKANNKLRKLK